MRQRGPFLDAIDDRAAAELEAAGVTRRWPAGSVVFHEGDHPDRVLVVREGRVKLVASEANGTEAVLAVRSPGELVGELAAVDGHSRSATAVAMDEVTCTAVPADRFRDLVDTNVSVASALVQVLAARLREADVRRVEFGALDATQRLARRLLELAADGSTVRGLNQEDLASLIGASRESVAKSLGDLRRAGLVRTGRLAIELVDVDGLRKRAG